VAETGTLHDAFVDELRDTYDAEKQLTQALAKLAEASSNAKLRQAFESEAAKLLQQTLDEEKTADKKLSGLAESGINQGAADAAHADEDQEPVGAAASSGRQTASSARTGRR
jgi:ferritin-like metal-binding protein YciE